MGSVTRTRWFVRFLLVLFVATPAVLVYLHLGPRMGIEKSPKILYSLSLDDGSRLFLILERNDHSLVDAYSSFLYRLYSDDRAEVTQLGYEDSYWWLPSLRHDATGKSIEIRAEGTIEGIYDTVSRVTSWPGQKLLPVEAKSVAPADPIRHKLTFTNP